MINSNINSALLKIQELLELNKRLIQDFSAKKYKNKGFYAHNTYLLYKCVLRVFDDGSVLVHLKDNIFLQREYFAYGDKNLQNYSNKNLVFTKEVSFYNLKSMMEKNKVKYFAIFRFDNQVVTF